ncbi:hypothetical protein BSR28_04775 [Boudabousia liubingyangii]|uniref:PGAP1-like alpha/beta domain-containing protein n=1 Tax=Boudabousia liubingyangii TaxID=1921764 RepID=UPI000939FE1A|nr:hypothetical protein [Boudabousia liubingyangii]OKL46761.1 hypothetical protein BSR28_04775 [Boudabousia liubingyangii]
MAREIKETRDIGWTPWPKQSLSERTFRSVTSRLARLPEYQEKAKSLPPILGIGARLGASVAESTVSVIPILPKSWSEAIGTRADERWAEGIEDMQEFFFDRPWLYETVVHSISRAAGLGAWTVKEIINLLEGNITNRQKRQRLQEIKEAVPSTGYRSFMKAYLLVATALGYFRGGKVEVRKICVDGEFLPVKFVPPFVRTNTFDDPRKDGLWADTNNPEHPLGKMGEPKNPILLEGRVPSPMPVNFEMRRLDPPQTLADGIADIDDLYWSSGAGMVVKVVKVGEGARRRWIVIVPGTDHMAPITMANPADTESNVREMLGLRSAARAGVEHAMIKAFNEAGIRPEERQAERVLMIGHSQGGVTAHAMAADPSCAINVTHVLTIGSPSRSIKLPEDVWNVSLEHTQDMIPWMDGVPTEFIDDRIRVIRELEKPQSNPLYYAHSTGTYLETVKILEARTRQKITDAARGGQPLDRTGRAVLELMTMLPEPEEPVTTILYEVAQHVLPKKNLPAISPKKGLRK